MGSITLTLRFLFFGGGGLFYVDLCLWECQELTVGGLYCTSILKVYKITAIHFTPLSADANPEGK
jgi:hypothetical protein